MNHATNDFRRSVDLAATSIRRGGLCCVRTSCGGTCKPPRRDGNELRQLRSKCGSTSHMSAQSRKSVTRLPVAEKSLLSHFSRFRTSSAVQTRTPRRAATHDETLPRDPARSHESPNARVNVAPPTRDMSDDEQEKQRSSASPAPAVGTARKADATGASADEPPLGVRRSPPRTSRSRSAGAPRSPSRKRPPAPPTTASGGARALFAFFQIPRRDAQIRAPGRHPRVHLTPPSLPFIPYPDS